MTFDEARHESARRWLEMADDALEVAKREKDLSPAAAVNRAYYAAFYAASAVLVLDGRHFVKHTAVRNAVHRHLVKTGRVPADIGNKYNQLMKGRTTADYSAVERCTRQQAAEAANAAEAVVAALKAILPPPIDD